MSSDYSDEEIQKLLNNSVFDTGEEEFAEFVSKYNETLSKFCATEKEYELLVNLCRLAFVEGASFGVNNLNSMTRVIQQLVNKNQT